MLLACHLFFGTLLGIFLGKYFNRQNLVYVCMVGSLLPDLIDKPFGILIIPGVHDGRMICHTIIGLFFIIAIVWFLLRNRLIALALGAGVLIHQILDTMWQTPENWLFPLFGPFPVHDNFRYFENGLIRELTTPSEWLFLAGTLTLILMIRRNQPGRDIFWVVAGVGIPAVILLAFRL